MADLFTGVFDGASGAEALVVNAIANESLKIGSPVTIIAAGSGELLPRVAHPAAKTDAIYGVVVGGDNNGIWVDGSTTNDGNAAENAGEVVKVCVFGRCKVRVDGAVAGITLGDGLAFDADGFARVEEATSFTFGFAMQASTADGDAILCMVQPTGVQT